MTDQNLGHRCKYSDECPYYEGKQSFNKTPLLITRNVFCYRGKKGWINCIHFNKLEENSYNDESAISN